MTLRQLRTPCSVIAYPDGTRDSRWDERHFADRELAADTLSDELDREPGEGDPAAAELGTPCFVVVCDGCGGEYGQDDGMTDHFASPSDAAWHSGDTEFRADGTTWCEDCRSYDDEPVTPDRETAARKEGQ